MSTQSGTIVLVDDEPVILTAASSALMAVGYTVHTCSDWTEVARIVRDASPDLVLLDYNMPSLKGDYICTVLKRNLERDLKVFLYSSEPEAELRLISNACGADGFIPKNAVASEFVSRVIDIVSTISVR